MRKKASVLCRGGLYMLEVHDTLHVAYAGVSSCTALDSILENALSFLRASLGVKTENHMSCFHSVLLS